jgi:Cu2+-exporting ATPase
MTIAQSVDHFSKENLSVYDDPVVQRSFVRAHGRERDTQLLIEGIRCAGCASKAEKTMANLAGVLRVEVNFSTHRATLRWDDTRIRLSEILAAVACAGFRATPYDRDGADRKRRDQRRDLLWRLFVACFGMMQVMMYAVPAYLAGDGDMSADIGQLMRWASFVLTVPVVAYAAAPFFKGAWRDLSARRLGMDVPIALGVAIAFGASVVATITAGAEVYYDSVTMFVFLLLLGRYLELVARQRAGAALAHMERLIPEFAHRFAAYPDSRETRRVPVASLKAGDIVLSKAGETFPADGEVVEGSGASSEALLTGESRPVSKGPGSPVTGGAVNLTSPLVVRVTRVGKDSVLSSILSLVGSATADKPPLIRLADRVASHFILVVLVLAILAGAFWMMNDPSRAVLVVVSVLVATCPCALSLAMPAALTAATGSMAGRGLVVCRGHAIESLAGVTDVVFDKTGTLTFGEPQLMEVRVFGALSRQKCLAVAGALEASSEHPIAKAFLAGLARACPGTGAAGECRVARLCNIPGSGIEAFVDGRVVRLGTASFVRELATVGVMVQDVSRDSIIWLGDAAGVLASFRLADTLRPEAAAVTGELVHAGLNVHLLSGDDRAPTHELATILGIRNVEAQAGPRRKLDYVRALQRAGRKVLMVGDGINDSPVLAQADVSIAMGSGTRLAQIQADAVLLEGKLGSLPDCVSISRKTLRVIKQNVAWAFGYNLLVLPLAFAGALTPWAAAIGMSASSLIVVLNALRLQQLRQAEPVRPRIRVPAPTAV